MLQEKIFKHFLNINLVFVQLFGFWPYTFHSTARLFRPSQMFYIYSVVLMIGFNVAYFVYFRNLYTFFLQVFKSDSAKMSVLYVVSCSAVIKILVFIIQLVKLNKFNEIFVESKCLMQKLNRVIEMEGVSYSKELILFTVKVFVIGFLNISLSYTKLTSDPASIVFGFIIPDVMISIMANNFYGVLLIVVVYLKQMNNNIHNVTHLAVVVQRSDKTNLEKIEAFCHLSDRLNELTKYQYRLCCLTRKLCDIFSFHITAWIIHKVCIILVQLFLIYILVTMLMFRNGQINLIAPAVTTIQVLIAIVELLFISKACNDANNEVY